MITLANGLEVVPPDIQPRRWPPGEPCPHCGEVVWEMRRQPAGPITLIVHRDRLGREAICPPPRREGRGAP